MITRQNHIKIFPDEIDSCLVIIPITDGIAKKQEFFTPLLARIRIRLFQSRRIAMSITHYRIFHLCLSVLWYYNRRTTASLHVRAKKLHTLHFHGPVTHGGNVHFVSGEFFISSI